MSCVMCHVSKDCVEASISLAPRGDKWDNRHTITFRTPQYCHRNIFSTCGNFSKVVVCLELGLIPLNFLIIKKKKTIFHIKIHTNKTNSHNDKTSV